ncbi:MAG: Na(+)-translocating NADH-quinone reductase subunit A [Salibacteraceae bacterium]
MAKSVKIRKGVDIKLVGKAEKVYTVTTSDTYAIKPTDFHGVVPKLTVKVGAEVKAGDSLFFDKNHPEVIFTSPVSGEVVEINRGAKRKILEVKVLADKQVRYKEFRKADPKSLSREEILGQLLEAGIFPSIRQRPFDVMANPQLTPKSVVVSAFDSAPLAPDYDFIVHGKERLFQVGIDALTQLTTGKVHLNVRGDSNPSEVFTKAKNVQLNSFSGPHPAGNAGVQLHHIDPINKGENVWVLDPQAVLAIGMLFEEGRYNAERVIALVGSEVEKPRYIKVIQGTCVKNLLEGNLKQGKDLRIISGNVLTGTTITQEGYLGFYHPQITVIPEGNHSEFLGWIAPGFDKFSLSRTFFSWLMPSKNYSLDTNKHGEKRAFVVTGQYEKVFPMDIYPMHLIKAIMVEDVELMENLGIYEVAPEDFALCEFACTSKINLQDIVREGLDIVRKEYG